MLVTGATRTHRIQLIGDIQVPHEVWDLYVFDWFEATTAAAVGSKMSSQIFVWDLAP